MTKSKYFIGLYGRYIKTNYLPAPGLCNCVKGKHSRILELFEPQASDKVANSTFWGYEFPHNDGDRLNRSRKFTSLRQTILLFCAAINNEL